MARKIPDYVGEHFAKYPPDAPRFGVRPVITCADGMQYSVQASTMHYCHPRDDKGPWAEFEVWARRNGKWRTENPEGWVPRDKINARIHRHGGVAI
jgi:hypothetical protein